MADFLPAWKDEDHLASEVGRLPWPDFWPTPWPEHRELQVMVRPDCLEIVSDENGSGTVVAREFLGAFNIYSVELPSATTVSA